MSATATISSETTTVQPQASTMTAARIHDFGDPEIFTIEAAPIPELQFEPGMDNTDWHTSWPQREIAYQ